MGAVYLFPGQGSQKVGMGSEFYNSSREIFNLGNRIIGRDITDIMFHGPADELKKTVNCQPAVLIAGLVYHSLLTKCGVKCDLAMGHSVGELAALVACGSLGLEDSLRLVKVRSEAMAKCIPDEPVKKGFSHMAAVITQDHSWIYGVCKRVPEEYGTVEVANINSPSQLVISGNVSAVDRAIKDLVAMGTNKRNIILLDVEGPYHSKHMRPAAKKIREELRDIEIAEPKIGFIANVTGYFSTTPKEIKDFLAEQVHSTVLWNESLETAIRDGNEEFVESGFGRIQSSLVKRAYPDVKVLDKEGIIY
jgi:[acyl-carrier-protein] S-malonyltransferase